MGVLKNEKQLAKFTYDFSRDGGAQGSISLKPEITELEAGMIITDMFVYCPEALASAGSHTVTLGNSDVDGFMADFASLAGSDNSVIRIGEVDGALMYDSVNSHKLAYRVDADTALALEIGTADLTAGKLEVYVEFLAP